MATTPFAPQGKTQTDEATRTAKRTGADPAHALCDTTTKARYLS